MYGMMVAECPDDSTVSVRSDAEEENGNTGRPENDTEIEPFIEVEQDPQFPGGQRTLLDWVKDHIEYPKEALAEKIQGRVVVRFTVRTDGSVDSVEVARGLHPLLDAEAVRVVSALPKFTPGKFNGKIVDCIYIMPVNFKLPETNENNK